MQLNFGLSLAVLLVCVAKGHSHLQCYVCDNCAKIDKNTPLQTCGTDAVATITAITPSETTSTTEMSTSKRTSTSTSTSTSTTTTTTPEDPTTVSTRIPTPPTVGPLPSTTEVPTPANVGTVVPFDLELTLNNTPTVNSTTMNNFTSETPTLFVTPEEPATTFPSLGIDSNETTPSTLLVRARRHIPENGITYHCFKVQKKYDNIYGTQRGCMGVQTQQSVCGELKAANSNQILKCRPCSTNMCNGSATIGASIAALMVAMVTLIFRV